MIEEREVRVKAVIVGGPLHGHSAEVPLGGEEYLMPISQHDGGVIVHHHRLAVHRGEWILRHLGVKA